MRPQIITGIVFGTINLITNILLVMYAPAMQLGMLYTCGLLAFNILFSILFFKKSNHYELSYSEGLRCAVQAGMVQAIFFFLSFVIINKYIKPNFASEFQGFFQYLMLFNLNIIVFSIFSFIFGLIVSGFLKNKKTV